MKITKEVQISGLADAKMRGQIGAVCVHSSLLELMVERVLANLQGKAGMVSYSEDLAHRLDTLKAVAKASTLSDYDKKTIVQIIGRIKTLLNDRHRVIHGLWRLPETPICRHQIVSIWLDSALGSRFGLACPCVLLMSGAILTKI